MSEELELASAGRTPEVHCTGELGVNAMCLYKGLIIVLSGARTLGEGHKKMHLGDIAGNNNTSSSASLTIPSGSGKWVISAGDGDEIGAGATHQGADPEVTINALLARSDHCVMGDISMRPRPNPVFPCHPNKACPMRGPELSITSQSEASGRDTLPVIIAHSRSSIKAAVLL